MLAPHGRPTDFTILSDDDLVDLARNGVSAAYGELWRRHSGIGRSIARRYYEIADPDDLVSEAFARILSTIQRGGGPRSGFRPYLITTIGNVARRWATRSRDSASEDLDLLEDPKTINDPLVAAADQQLALRAFQSLPSRWQSVLWYSAVEGMGPTELAGYLGMTPNAAAVLTHRARAGLRTAWVQEHLNDETLSEDCRWTAGRLGRHAAGTLSAREFARVKEHLRSCLGCRKRARELDYVTSKLAVLLVPALLGLAGTLADSDATAEAAIPPSELAAPLLAPAHAWLAGVAVAVVTVTALLTAGAPPESASSDSAPSQTQSPDRPAPQTFPASDANLTVPTLSDAATDVADESTPVNYEGGVTAGDTAPVAPPVGPPAPSVSASVDPDSVTPPSLSGSALPGAQVLITDELGASIATVVADAAGTWSTGALASLSPAAAAIVIRQVDAAGLVSVPTTVPLAVRPSITGPLVDPDSPWQLGLMFPVTGWPGSTAYVDFAPTTSPYFPAGASYADVSVVLDAQGQGMVRIDPSIPDQHHMDVTYVDGSRQSSLVRGYDFYLYWPD